MLFNKYDLPENNSDRTVITYKNKTYGGIAFDYIHFYSNLMEFIAILMVVFLFFQLSL